MLEHAVGPVDVDGDAAFCSPEALARFFRVLGDPTRLRLQETLLEGEHTVAELTQIIGAPRSRISNHLACLKWCRYVESEPRGRNVVYRVSDPRVAATTC